MFTSPWFFFTIAGVLLLWLVVIDPLIQKRKPKKQAVGPRRTGKTTPVYKK